MKSGFISTEKLLRFAQNDLLGLGIWGSTKEGRQFAAAATSLIPRELNDVSGFYCWAKVEESPSFLYIGQSHNLFRRISENFKHERLAFWKTAWGDISNYRTDGIKHYPKKWHQYQIGWDRCIKKAGATHILWVATPELAHFRLELIESELIIKANPSGNTQNTKDRKNFNKLPVDIQELISNHARKITAKFADIAGECIAHYREDRFHLKAEGVRGSIVS